MHNISAAIIQFSDCSGDYLNRWTNWRKCSSKGMGWGIRRRAAPREGRSPSYKRTHFKETKEGFSVNTKKKKRRKRHKGILKLKQRVFHGEGWENLKTKAWHLDPFASQLHSYIWFIVFSFEWCISWHILMFLVF